MKRMHENTVRTTTRSEWLSFNGTTVASGFLHEWLKIDKIKVIEVYSHELTNTYFYPLILLEQSVTNNKITYAKFRYGYHDTIAGTATEFVFAFEITPNDEYDLLATINEY